MKPIVLQNPTAESKKLKASAGRKKIAMRKIENRGKLSTCFTKRRQGLFNTAAELSIISGANIAIITFSPAGRPYCFGSPSAASVIDRTLNRNHAPLEVDGRVLEQLKLLSELQREIDEEHAKMRWGISELGSAKEEARVDELAIPPVRWMEEEDATLMDSESSPVEHATFQPLDSFFPAA